MLSFAKRAKFEPDMAHMIWGLIELSRHIDWIGTEQLKLIWESFPWTWRQKLKFSNFWTRNFLNFYFWMILMRIRHLGPVNHRLEGNSCKNLSKSNRHSFEIQPTYAIINSLTSQWPSVASHWVTDHKQEVSSEGLKWWSATFMFMTSSWRRYNLMAIRWRNLAIFINLMPMISKKSLSERAFPRPRSQNIINWFASA